MYASSYSSENSHQTKLAGLASKREALTGGMLLETRVFREQGHCVPERQSKLKTPVGQATT